MKPLKKYETVAAKQTIYFIMYVIATALLYFFLTCLVKDIRQSHVVMTIVYSFAVAFIVAFGGITLFDWAQHYHEDKLWYLDGFTPLIVHMCIVWTFTYYFVQRLKLLPP